MKLPKGGDRGADREHGEGSLRRVAYAVAELDEGHLLGPTRRTPIGYERPKGRTRDQLYNEARQLGIEGRSSMNKQQLQRAVAGKES